MVYIAGELVNLKKKKSVKGNLTVSIKMTKTPLLVPKVLFLDIYYTAINP